MDEQGVGLTSVLLVNEDIEVSVELCLEWEPVLAFLAASETTEQPKPKKAGKGEGTWTKAQRFAMESAPVIDLAIETGLLLGVESSKALRPNALMWIVNRLREHVAEATTFGPN